MPEEAVFFGRSGLFGLVLAGLYWFASYEIVGTVLLAGFGAATGAVFLLLARSARRTPARHAEPPEAAERGRDEAAPFEDEGGLVPLRSFAPLWVGVGVGVMSLALGFGLWFVLAGLVPFALGAGAWLAEVGREADATAGR
jgi:Cytochrome c oxidase subunit IV